MAFVIENEEPTRLYLDDLSSTDKLVLQSSLSYIDQKLMYQATRFKNTGGWFKNKHGQQAFDDRIKELKNEAKKTLLFEEQGRYYTYSGLYQKVERLTNKKVNNEVEFPDLGRIKTLKEPPSLRPYQQEIVDALIKAKHASVSAATGLGKSRCVLEVTRALGLKTLIMTPSSSISEQLYDDFVKCFGKEKVGAFWGGKKEASKMIVIGNAQSLTRIEPGSKIWCDLLKTKVFISDESHLCAAETLASVCFGVMKKTPYRFFFSATQMRNDGLDLLLDGIIGPVVYTMPLSKGVEQGFLSKPIFHMVKVASDVVPNKKADPMAVTREFLYYNDNVIQSVARYVNMAVKSGMPTVVLIEEVEQFSRLLPFLDNVPLFAHGTLNDENKRGVPEKYWKSDPNELVSKFNNLEHPLLIGTSCVSTGTDIRPVKFLVYWQGGKSEIQVKQAVGRGTRLYPGKNKCNILDFDVYNVDTLHRHAQARVAIYEDLLGPVKFIEP